MVNTGIPRERKSLNRIQHRGNVGCSAEYKLHCSGLEHVTTRTFIKMCTRTRTRRSRIQFL